MPHTTTVEISAQDISELEELMYIYLIENEVIKIDTLTNEELLKLKKPHNRLKFIHEFVDAYLYANAIWRLSNVHSYDSYLEPIIEEYCESEFESLTYNRLNLQKVLSCMERDIINDAIPQNALNKTWMVWNVTLVATSLLFRNEGDYRILSFAEEATENHEHPFYGKVSKRTLYDHELK